MYICMYLYDTHVYYIGKRFFFRVQILQLSKFLMMAYCIETDFVIKTKFKHKNNT